MNLRRGSGEIPGPILIRGGGEMATGVAAALYRAGFSVAIVETARPRAIRQTVSFATAVYSGSITIENLQARLCTAADMKSCWDEAIIPVVVDEAASIRESRDFSVLVDAILSKTNAGGTDIDWAPLVIGLGPGFRAGENCHLVIETQRGHFLGRVYDKGAAAPNTGVPGEIGGVGRDRVLRAPVSGKLQPCLKIASRVKRGEPVAHIDGIPAEAAIDGVLRGLLPSGSLVNENEKIGDIDPRGCPDYCHLISDKARQIGLGVLSAILWHHAGRPGRLPPSTH